MLFRSDDTTHEDIGGTETNASSTVLASNERTPLKENKSDVETNFFPTGVAHHTPADLGSMPVVDSIPEDTNWTQIKTKTSTNIETGPNKDTDIGLSNNMEGVSPSSIVTVTDTLDVMTGAERTTIKLQYPKDHVKVSAHVNGLRLDGAVKHLNKDNDPDTHTDALLHSRIVTHSNQDSFNLSNHPQPRSQIKCTFLDILSRTHTRKHLVGVSDENRRADNMTLLLIAKNAMGILPPQSTVPHCKDVNRTSSPLRSSRLICFIVLWALGVTAAVFLGLTIFLRVCLSVQKERGRRGSGRLRETAKGLDMQSLWVAQKSSVEERVEFWYANGATMEFDNRGKDSEKGRLKWERGEGFWAQPKVTLDDITEFWYVNGRALTETQI